MTGLEGSSPQALALVDAAQPLIILVVVAFLLLGVIYWGLNR